MYELINGIPMPIREYNGQRVLTTAQLAEAYETTVDTINRNFNNNKSRYIEGKHYYRLTGEDLKNFASVNFTGANSNKIRILYLWTERGSLLHAKSLNTDKAWEVYDFLMENYFRTYELKTSYSDALLKMYQRQNELESRLALLENRLANKVPEKNIRWENAKYVLEKLNASGEWVFTKHRVLILCRPLKAKQVTPALEMLDEMNIISYRKVCRIGGGNPKEIIVILKTERTDFQ